MTHKKQDFRARLYVCVCPRRGQDETAVYRHKSLAQWHSSTPHLSIQTSVASETGNAGMQTLILYIQMLPWLPFSWSGCFS